MKSAALFMLLVTGLLACSHNSASRADSSAVVEFFIASKNLLSHFSAEGSNIKLLNQKEFKDIRYIENFNDNIAVIADQTIYLIDKDFTEKKSFKIENLSKILIYKRFIVAIKSNSFSILNDNLKITCSINFEEGRAAESLIADDRLIVLMKDDMAFLIADYKFSEDGCAVLTNKVPIKKRFAGVEYFWNDPNSKMLHAVVKYGNRSNNGQKLLSFDSKELKIINEKLLYAESAPTVPLDQIDETATGQQLLGADCKWLVYGKELAKLSATKDAVKIVPFTKLIFRAALPSVLFSEDGSISAAAVKHGYEVLILKDLPQLQQESYFDLREWEVEIISDVLLKKEMGCE